MIYIKLYTLTVDAKLQDSFRTSSRMTVVLQIDHICLTPIVESIHSLVSQALPWTCCNSMGVVWENPQNQEKHPHQSQVQSTQQGINDASFVINSFITLGNLFNGFILSRRARSIVSLDSFSNEDTSL